MITSYIEGAKIHHAEVDEHMDWNGRGKFGEETAKPVQLPVEWRLLGHVTFSEMRKPCWLNQNGN